MDEILVVTFDSVPGVQIKPVGDPLFASAENTADAIEGLRKQAAALGADIVLGLRMTPFREGEQSKYMAYGMPVQTRLVGPRGPSSGRLDAG